MKSADEIKKGLACCAASIYQCADDCPYREECRNGQGGKAMMEDALALLQQKEAENAEHAKKIRRLETENRKLSNMIDLLRSERYNSYGHAGPGIRDNY